MDGSQLLLAGVIVLLTLTLTFLGLQAALILKEMREFMRTMNEVGTNIKRQQSHLDDILSSVSQTTQTITDKIAVPAASAIGTLGVVKEVLSLFRKGTSDTEEKDRE